VLSISGGDQTSVIGEMEKGRTEKDLAEMTPPEANMFLSSHKRDILTRFLDKGSEEELYLDI
jgi:hypothetical protein